MDEILDSESPQALRVRTREELLCTCLAAWDGCQPPLPCSRRLCSGNLGNSEARSVQTTVMLVMNPLVSSILLFRFSCIHKEILCCFSLLWMLRWIFFSRANTHCPNGRRWLQLEDGSPAAASQEGMQWMLLIRFTAPASVPRGCQVSSTLPCYGAYGCRIRTLREWGDWARRETTAQAASAVSGGHTSRGSTALQLQGLHLVCTITPKSIWEIGV